MTLILDFLPLLAFFALSKLYNMSAAIAALIVLSLISAVFHYLKTKKIPYVPLLTAAVVTFFGGLSLYLHDDSFIKMKPTIVNVILSLVVWVGWKMQKNPLRVVIGAALDLTPRGWHILHRNYAAFFMLMAACNEFAWRHLTTDQWVSFKVFGLVGVSLVFSFVQMTWIQKHTIAQDTSPD
jgi:intracellular septation protein